MTSLVQRRATTGSVVARRSVAVLVVAIVAVVLSVVVSLSFGSRYITKVRFDRRAS